MINNTGSREEVKTSVLPACSLDEVRGLLSDSNDGGSLRNDINTCTTTDSRIYNIHTVWPEGMVGKTDASTMRKFGMPCTRRWGSTTPSSSSGAMRAVLVG